MLLKASMQAVSAKSLKDPKKKNPLELKGFNYKKLERDIRLIRHILCLTLTLFGRIRVQKYLPDIFVELKRRSYS